MFFRETFAKALRRAVADLNRFGQHMSKFRDYKVKGEGDAQAIVEALDVLEKVQSAPTETFSPLHRIAAFLQSAEDREAFRFLRKHAIPRLIRVVTAKWDQQELRDDLMFCIQQLALYQTEESVPVVVRAMHEWPDGYLWRSIMHFFAEQESPQADLLIRTIGHNIPKGNSGVAYLECVNTRAHEYGMAPHPFASENGIRFLKDLLKDQESDNAISAAVAIPFLPEAPRSELLSLALEHSNWEVHLEAAWAMARVGNENGFKLMVELSKDVHKFIRVARYLHELGRYYLLPFETQSEDFQAMAEMSNWLQHPNELGRVPDELIQVDTRKIFWPPTNDTRRVWLFRFSCKPADGAEPNEYELGVGMVGSVTWAMLETSTASMKPEEVYALHCCWELQQNDDDLAPEEIDIQAGLKILRKYNPEM